MNFAFVPESTDPSITVSALVPIAGAIVRQLAEHAAPMWEASGATIVVVDSLDKAPADAWVVAILDNADQAGVLGYHDVTPDGRPYARVFWQPIRDAGGTISSGATSLSVTLSHEVLEAWADAYVDFWSDVAADTKEIALELCDPVEGFAYEIDGVSVSDFVGPRFFRSGPGPYDWMGHLAAPFEIAPSGYGIFRMGGPGGTVQSVFGAKFDDWKKAGKMHPAARSYKRGAR